MMDKDILTAAEALLAQCREKGLMLAAAESCTGGLVTAVLTEIAGSSDVVDRGFVTYSNAAKTSLLGVPQAVLDMYGAVSEQTARAMVSGALDNSCADLAVSITGIAGPGGGSADKPVGLVHFAAQRRGDEANAYHTVFSGDRSAVREASLRQALTMLSELAAQA